MGKGSKMPLKELSNSDMKNLYGGNISASMINYLFKGLNIFTDLGRYVGSGLRRIFDKHMCDF